VLRGIYARLISWNRNKSKIHKFNIVTPNPEIVTEAYFNAELKRIINKSTFSVPDGIGLAQASCFMDFPKVKIKSLAFGVYPVEWIYVSFLTWLMPQKLRQALNITKGRTLFSGIVSLCNKKSWKVVLLGDEKESAQKAKDVLERSFKKVDISAFSFPNLDRSGVPVSESGKGEEKQILEKINKISPHMVFIGFGAPKQEMWLKRNFAKVTCGGMMTLGGTFDYVSGKAKLPPKVFTHLNLEWVWRMITQPFRIKRILTAFPGFPIRVIKYKLSN